ncbi:MAG TPA: hypothetical protein VM431_09240 [Phycisphaerae bacterium]|nr:hypothetical protein [Phycisphaerae bacterium]
MPLPGQDEGSRFLRHLMEGLSASLRRRAAASAALWATATVLAALAILLLAGAALRLSASVWPAVWVVAGSAGVAAVGVAALRAWRRRPSPEYVARVVESQRPELKCALVTFAELVSDPSADASLRAAVARRAAVVLARDGPATFLPPFDVRRPALAVAGAFMLLGATLWLFQGTLIRPWTSAAQAGVLSGETRPGGDAPGPVGSDSSVGAEDVAQRPSAVAAAVPETPAPAVPHAAQDAEAAAAKALASALRADARMFERLAAAIGADRPVAGAAGSRPGDGPAGSGRAVGSAGPPGKGTNGASAAAGDGQDLSRRTRTGGGAAGDETVSRGNSVGRSADDAKTPDPSNDAAAVAGGGLRSTGGAGAARRPHQPAADPPLLDREPSDQFLENALDAMRRARRLIEEADRRLREGEVTDAFLGRMGLGNAEFRRFVVAWDRRLVAAGAGPDVAPQPSGAEMATGDETSEVLRPSGGSDARPIVGPVDAGPGGRKGVVESAAARVSPRLRPAVDAYFETVGALTEEPDRRDAPR